MVEERVRLLSQTKGMVVVNGRQLKPGTSEYRQALERMVSTLSDQEFQGLATSKAAAGSPGGGLTPRRRRPT